MRALLALAASLLLPLPAAAAQPAGAGERYVPVDALPDREDADFYDAWIGETLRAMGEPALLARPLPAGVRRRFRLLVAVNHRGSTALRIDQRSAGRAAVRVVRVDGRDPPHVVGRRVYELDRAAMLEVERAIGISGFRNTPLRARRTQETNEICVPYSRFFFELVDRAGSRFVVRHACALTPPLRRLIDTLQPLFAR